MKENLNVIKKQNDKSKIYCHEDYAQEMYNILSNVSPRSKEINDGDIFRVVNFILHGSEIEAVCENLESLFFSFSKEKKYFEMLDLNEDSFYQWVLSGSHQQFLSERKVYIRVENKNVRKGSLYSAHLITIANEFKEQIKNPTSAYIAKIISKNQGGFIVDVQGIKAFLPGSLAAANKIIDFESFVGKQIYVMIEDYLQPSGVFIVSYKKYLESILPSKLAELEMNQLMTGVIIGTSDFGIFIEFDEIFTGLLHITEMNQETLDNFNNKKFKNGESIEVWLKDIKDNKLILTQIDPNIRQNELKQLKEIIEGKIQDATIISIKSHGALMEIEKGVIGLLPVKEMKKTEKRLNIGETFPVFIKKVDSSTGKIYLTLSDEHVTTKI